jgi:hypothetical protein
VSFINQDRWESVVGQYMLAFGDIESSINELIRQMCPASTLVFALPLLLHQRMTLLRLALEEFELLNGKNRQVLNDTLDEVSNLAKTRNLIAHNPLVLQFYAGSNQLDRQMKEVIKHEHMNKSIDLGELRKVAARANKVAAALNMMWIGIDMHLMNDKPIVFKTPSQIYRPTPKK